MTNGLVDVPRTIDASPRFLFWEIDYVMVTAVGYVVGDIVCGMTAGFISAALFCWAWKKARAGGGVSRAFALFYWYLPIDVLDRVPASSRRHFAG